MTANFFRATRIFPLNWLSNSYDLITHYNLFGLLNFKSKFSLCLNITWNFYQLDQVIYRSSHQRCSVRKGVLRNFGKFIGQQLCQGLFFNKVAGFRPASLWKKRLWHRCFPANFPKFLRTPFLQNISGRLLLDLFICRTYFLIMRFMHVFFGKYSPSLNF